MPNDVVAHRAGKGLVFFFFFFLAWAGPSLYYIMYSIKYVRGFILVT
jgi:hypothetical protein